VAGISLPAMGGIEAKGALLWEWQWVVRMGKQGGGGKEHSFHMDYILSPPIPYPFHMESME
jgi:hypothetical protein